jgi:hypothetical protein
MSYSSLEQFVIIRHTIFFNFIDPLDNLMVNYFLAEFLQACLTICLGQISYKWIYFFKF